VAAGLASNGGCHGQSIGWHDFSSAVTWSSGVYVAPLLLNLSAQTGYSSHGHVFYRFSRNRHLCGTNNYPGEAAQDVVKT
jgi:hypothetical protein